MIYPWQNKEWQTLMYAVQAKRLSHALLLIGLPGLGKAKFAESLTRVLLCENPPHDSYCGNCHACRLISGKTHPNVLWIMPDGNSIKVDQVREINGFLNLSGLKGTYRIVLIYSADKMNINAANALLKTLEEPTAFSLILLISESENLPITIKSRCQRIHFSVPPKEQALAWLAKQLSPAKGARSMNNDVQLLLNLAHGAPLAALSLAKEKDALSVHKSLLEAFCLVSNNKVDPIQKAGMFQALNVDMILDTAISFIMDLLRLQFGVDASCLTNKDFSEEFKAIAQQKSCDSYVKLMDDLQRLRSYLCNNINLNKLLLIENMFIRLAECC